MKKLIQTFCLVLLAVNVSAQTVTLPPYYGVNSSAFKCGVSTVKDYEGNTYNTVKIGNQCWLKENLKSTKLNDSTSIPNVISGGTTWAGITTPAYCWYNNDYATYGSVYGALYNWYTVNTGKLCPLGWHVPSDAEWTQLTDFLGGESVAGGKLKETGTTHWNSPNTGATNETSFTALPSGVRVGEVFSGIQFFGNWWSATEREFITSWLYSTSCDHSGLTRESVIKRTGYPVRCIKN